MKSQAAIFLILLSTTATELVSSKSIQTTRNSIHCKIALDQEMNHYYTSTPERKNMFKSSRHLAKPETHEFKTSSKSKNFCEKAEKNVIDEFTTFVRMLGAKNGGSGAFRTDSCDDVVRSLEKFAKNCFQWHKNESDRINKK